VHELGHSIGNLADEYTYSDHFSYSIPDDFILECQIVMWKDAPNGT